MGFPGRPLKSIMSRAFRGSRTVHKSSLVDPAMETTDHAVGQSAEDAYKNGLDESINDVFAAKNESPTPSQNAYPDPSADDDGEQANPSRPGNVSGVEKPGQNNFPDQHQDGFQDDDQEREVPYGLLENTEEPFRSALENTEEPFRSPLKNHVPGRPEDPGREVAQDDPNSMPSSLSDKQSEQGYPEDEPMTQPQESPDDPEEHEEQDNSLPASPALPSVDDLISESLGAIFQKVEEADPKLKALLERHDDVDMWDLANELSRFSASIGASEYQEPTYDEAPQYDQEPQYDPEPGYNPEPQYDPEPQQNQAPQYDPEPGYNQEPQYDQEPPNNQEPRSEYRE